MLGKHKKERIHSRNNFLQMHDHWTIVLQFANAVDLIRISHLNKTWKKYLLEIFFSQRLVIKNFKQFYDICEYISRVNHFSFIFLENIAPIENKLCNLNKLYFLDLWNRGGFHYRISKLHSSLKGLRLDVNFQKVQLLSFVAPHLQHLTCYCTSENVVADAESISTVFARFTKLKRLHLLKSPLTYVSWFDDLKNMKFPFVMSFKTYTYSLFQTSMICEHCD
jgi:hypothetical protein